jgi:hypothetical protein
VWKTHCIQQTETERECVCVLKMSDGHHHGGKSVKKKKKGVPKGSGIRKSALGTYAEMLNWEQRVKNEEKGSNEWTEVWGDIYKPREEGDSDEKELMRNIEK